MKHTLKCPECELVCSVDIANNSPVKAKARCPRCKTLFEYELEEETTISIRIIDEKIQLAKKRRNDIISIVAIVSILIFGGIFGYQQIEKKRKEAEEKKREVTLFMKSEQARLQREIDRRIAVKELRNQREQERHRIKDEVRLETEAKNKRVAEWEKYALNNFAILDVHVVANTIFCVLKPEKISTKANAQKIARLIAKSYCYQTGENFASCKIISPHNLNSIFAGADYYHRP